MLFVGRPAVRVRVPGAIPGRLHGQGNAIFGGENLGPFFEAQAGVVEKAQRQGFQIGGLPRGQAQAAVIDPGAQAPGVLVIADLGEEHAAAAIMGKPGGDDAIAAGGVRQGQPHVTARVVIRRQETARAQGFDRARRTADVDGRVEGFVLFQDLGFGFIIAHCGAQQRERQAGKKEDAVAMAIGAVDLNGASVSKHGILDRGGRGFAPGRGEFGGFDENHARRLGDQLELVAVGKIARFEEVGFEVYFMFGGPNGQHRKSPNQKGGCATVYHANLCNHSPALGQSETGKTMANRRGTTIRLVQKRP